MELKLRDDVTKEEKLWFAGLVAGLILWSWFVFYSGFIL